MKVFGRVVLASYVLVLMWLVLFKFSADIGSVIATYQARSLNLVPFAHLSLTDVRDNVLAFVPLGLQLGVSFPHRRNWPKATFIVLLSVAMEATQYALAIGATDITDVIDNSLGGLVALGLYGLSRKWITSDRLGLVRDLLSR